MKDLAKKGKMAKLLSSYCYWSFTCESVNSTMFYDQFTYNQFLRTSRVLHAFLITNLQFHSYFNQMTFRFLTAQINFSITQSPQQLFHNS